MSLYDITIVSLFYDFIIPFTIVSIATYHFLGSSTTLFKKEKENGDLIVHIIALSISFFVVNYTPTFLVLNIDNFGRIGLTFIAILFFSLIYLESKQIYTKHKIKKEKK